MGKYKTSKKIWLGGGVLLAVLGYGLWANQVSAPAWSDKEVVFLRSVYEDAGQWYLVADLAGDKYCAETNTCKADDDQGLPTGIKTYILPSRFDYYYFISNSSKLKRQRLSPAALDRAINQDNKIQATPFVLTATKDEITRLEQVYDPLF